ncbi:hypothetical protein [Jiulongibacter sp. NS-SX5]|uniref:hypothetical protein n=1 Tax=Jiulongibacter sp. NS-SX5 TaxID=3463854 RepID=UPI00405A14DC
MHIQFQTNELTPPPYAHAIEIKVQQENNGINIDFEITYLGREELEEEEILQEGFSTNDDIQWSGELNQEWLKTFEQFANSVEFKEKTSLNQEEFYWNIKTDHQEGYPVDEEAALQFVQELQQAVLENTETEAPLNLTILRKDRNTSERIVFEASFAKRQFSKTTNDSKEDLPWDTLSQVLKDIFSGEFRPEQAKQKSPKKTGLHINLGDDLWYELGKSYLIQPSKITQYL